MATKVVDRATLSEDELHAEEEAQFAAVTEATRGALSDQQSVELFGREQQLLDQMTELADSARSQPDARVRALVDWIRNQMCPGLASLGPASTLAATSSSAARSATPALWNETRILIFTEYDDTKRYLQQQLAAAIQGTDRSDDRIALFAGSTPAKSAESSTVLSREEIKQAFNADPAKHPLRILIATDAAREGLNLQAQCWNLFHFDVPWNPSRLEQRNGRIDRKLQPSPKVNCHYFVYKQRPEDRILRALVRKTETIKQELGSLAQVIDGRLADTLKLGIRRDSIDAMESTIDAAHLDPDRRAVIEGELEATRERQDALRAQIDKLRGLLAESQKSIGLSTEHFQSAISCALEMIGADSLATVKPADKSGAERLAFPALDQREGADPTWADTMDTLRAPKPRDQKYWEWRRRSPIRPVVFEDTGTMSDEAVHLHLEHRVVQRLLGRFVAQGFVHHDLSRACFAQTTDAIPRVVLLGRLCLYGPGAARLHEELVPVTARWTDAKIRKGLLAPYARETETKTMALLEAALIDAVGRSVSEVTLQQLQAIAPRDVQELLPHLTNRGEEYARDAERKLHDRAEAEAKAMREILETQKKHIESTAAKHDSQDAQQLQFDFQEEDERRQLEANRRYWGKRLAMLDQELRTEPDRIRELYQVKAKRIEPIGLVYLWPVTG